MIRISFQKTLLSSSLFGVSLWFCTSWVVFSPFNARYLLLYLRVVILSLCICEWVNDCLSGCRVRAKMNEWWTRVWEFNCQGQLAEWSKCNGWERGMNGQLNEWMNEWPSFSAIEREREREKKEERERRREDQMIFNICTHTRTMKAWTYHCDWWVCDWC